MNDREYERHVVVQRETRTCACGCGETFLCRPKEKKRFVIFHQN